MILDIFELALDVVIVVLGSIFLLNALSVTTLGAVLALVLFESVVNQLLFYGIFSMLSLAVVLQPYL
jgi:hypothetical protein